MIPLVIANGNVEVVMIDPRRKLLAMVIHVECNHPKDINSPENEEKIAKRESMACNYLIEEGFLPSNTDGWMTNLARIPVKYD